MRMRWLYEKGWEECSLGWRLALLVGGLMVSLALVTALFVAGHATQQVNAVGERVARSLAEMTARTLAPTLSEGNPSVVQHSLDALAQVEGVRRVALLDQQRRPLAQAGMAFDERHPQREHDGLCVCGAGYGLYHPIPGGAAGKPQGWLYIEVSIRAEGAARGGGWLLFLLAFGLLVLGCALALAVSRFVMKPLVELVNVTGDIAEGNWHRRARMGGPREMVALARAVNTMVVELVRARSDMEGRNADLRRRSLELALAKEHAEEAVRLRDTFLTNMSHEVRTPLAGILGTAQVLREEVEGPATELVDILESSGQRLLATLNDVLELSQLQSNTLRIDLQSTDIHALTSEVARTLRGAAQQKGLDFNVAPCMQPLYAEVDAAAFGRVLGHLVGNAIKFTDAGQVRVRVGNDMSGVFVAVSDTGIGIPPEQMPYLFEPFRQGSTGLARTHEGNGVGLAIARHYVQRMRGTISVESKPGQGSTFTVRLPRLRTRGGGFDGATWPDEEGLVTVGHYAA